MRCRQAIISGSNVVQQTPKRGADVVPSGYSIVEIRKGGMMRETNHWCHLRNGAPLPLRQPRHDALDSSLPDKLDASHRNVPCPLLICLQDSAKREHVFWILRKWRFSLSYSFLPFRLTVEALPLWVDIATLNFIESPAQKDMNYSIYAVSETASTTIPMWLQTPSRRMAVSSWLSVST